MSKKKAIICVLDDLMPIVMKCVKEAGYRLTLVDDFEGITDLLGHSHYDLIVHAARPPDGVNALEQLRESSNGAIIAIIESEDFSDCEPYLLFADDILLHGFDPKELTVRAKALSKHPRAPWNSRDKNGLPLVFGDLCIFSVGRKVTYKRAPVHLTRTEFYILYHLASNAGAAVTRYEIYTSVWNDTDFFNNDAEKNINNHISNIRKQLKKHTNHGYIHTENGEGYAFMPKREV